MLKVCLDDARQLVTDLLVGLRRKGGHCLPPQHVLMRDEVPADIFSRHGGLAARADERPWDSFHEGNANKEDTDGIATTVHRRAKDPLLRKKFSPDPRLLRRAEALPEPTHVEVSLHHALELATRAVQSEEPELRNELPPVE
jgi:hypothetical protein